MQRGYSLDDDFVVPDGEEASDDASDYGFEPMREAGKPRRVIKKQLGPPITIDEKLENLNQIHRAVVEDFLIRAKEESKKVSLTVNSDARVAHMLILPDPCSA